MPHANPLPEEVSPVRCGSCKRTVAMSKRPSPLRNAIFCDEWCLKEHPVSEKEVRTDHWRLLAISGVSPVRIASLYGVSHPLVYKTLNRK